MDIGLSHPEEKDHINDRSRDPTQEPTKQGQAQTEPPNQPETHGQTEGGNIDPHKIPKGERLGRDLDNPSWASNSDQTTLASRKGETTKAKEARDRQILTLNGAAKK